MLRQLGWIMFAVKSAANQGVTAGELELLKGTNSVVFQPIQAGGQLDGGENTTRRISRRRSIVGINHPVTMNMKISIDTT